MRYNIIILSVFPFVVLTILLVGQTVKWKKYQKAEVEENAVVSSDFVKRLSNNKRVYSVVLGDLRTKSVSWPFVETTPEKCDTIIVEF